MHPKTPKLLEDVRTAAAFVLGRTSGLGREPYLQDATLRFAVERNFEIIGEALNRLATIDGDTAERIMNLRRIVDFRNMLIHGYDAVNHERVWLVIRHDLPALHARVLELLDEAG